MADRPTIAVQENLLTILCWDDEAGRIVYNLLDPVLFEGDMRLVAQRACDYWREYGHAPQQHTPDLLAKELEDPHNRKANTYRQILASMIEWAPQVNKTYVMQELRKFTFNQRFKQFVVKAAERASTRQDLTAAEVETLWAEFHRAESDRFDVGLRLYDVAHLVKFLKERPGEFSSGVSELDRSGIRPERGTLFKMLGATGVGKTWFLVNCGKANLKLRKKVLHVTLETGAEHTQQRYFQNMFAVPKRYADKIDVRNMVIEKKFIKGIEKDYIKDLPIIAQTPEFAFDSSAITLELEEHIKALAGRCENLIIKEFPMRRLTVQQLEAYLDFLEMTEKFIPDMLILDSTYLMKIDPRNYRIELGRTVEDVRGLCKARNIAGVSTHQIGRKGAEAAVARGTHIAEDWSVMQTADIAVVMSKTDVEEQMGLGRLFVDKSRSEKGKFMVMITQNYDTGQFAIQSHRMSDNYWDVVKKESGDDNADQVEEDE
jgi:hypothetical protein